MKRLFAAIKIHPNDKLIELFDECKTELQGEQLKWVDVKNIHITLKFFSDTDAQKQKEISAIFSKIATEHTPFSFQLGKLGVFKNLANPTVLWVGIEKENDLKQLNSSIENGLKTIGYQPEKFGFSPHLTLARISMLKDKGNFRTLVESKQNEVFQNVEVSSFHLYESVLKPSGAVYTALETYKLGK